MKTPDQHSIEILESVKKDVENEYQDKINMIDEIERLTLDLLEGSIKYQNLKLFSDTIKKALHVALDEFEGRWDNDEKCDSPAIAMWYIETSKFLINERPGHKIAKVQEWYNNYPLNS